MSKENGGAAFPRPFSVSGSYPDSQKNHSQEGMSLRDYFAAKAMQALLTRLNSGPGNQAAANRMTRETADYSYATADAMLAAREVSK